MFDSSNVTDMAVPISLVTRKLHFAELVCAFTSTGLSETTIWSLSHGFAMLKVVWGVVVVLERFSELIENTKINKIRFCKFIFVIAAKTPSQIKKNIQS